MLRPAKVLFVLALTAGMMVLAPGTSWACSCVLRTTSQQVHAAETIVDGTVRWEASNGITTTYSVAVAKVYKGRAAEREKLVTSASEASCGLGSLATDKRYLFFIEGEHPGRMTVSLCGGSAAYSTSLVAKIRAITGEPTGPFATPGGTPGAVNETPIKGTPWYTVIGTIAIIAGVLGGLMFYARRTSRA